jgi:uncharacterized cupin superfamily protein
MAKIFNSAKMSFELRKSPIAEYAWHTSVKETELPDSKYMNFDVRSLDPGKYSYPYHFHRNAEEIFSIISGKAMLRTPSGFYELSEGDIVFFEIGPEGAHQLYNHTQEPCKYLDIRTVAAIDVCEYPDSGKVNILPYIEVFQKEDRVSYYKGEDKVSEKWPKDIVGR